MNATAQNRQSLLDMAIINMGSCENMFAFALLNNVSITDQLQVGIQLQLMSVIDPNVVNSYNLLGENPATDIGLVTTDINFRYFDNSFDSTFE